MGEVFRFISKSERERARLIREARALYDSVFPQAQPVSGVQGNGPASRTVNGVNGDGVFLS